MGTSQTNRLVYRCLCCFGLFTLICGLGFPSIVSAQTTETPEIIRVNSDLVDLKVSVLRLDPLNAIGELKPTDFLVLEDGQPQEISFFADESEPFDLVLVLDLSGSTSKKLKLVRESTTKFVEATRPIDRVAIVTFTDVPEIVSPLTLDREALRKSIRKIKEPSGGTCVWDALNFALISPATNGMRRRAIVVMTDGVDNALPGVFGDGSKITFAELLSQLQSSDVIVFPVYLDTEKEEVKKHRSPASAYTIARENLAQLADISGTKVYPAKELKDLDAVYDQVLKDLGTVYSLGYKSTNEVRDGKWRTVTVQVVGRTGISVRTKRGYYSRAAN